MSCESLAEIYSHDPAKMWFTLSKYEVHYKKDGSHLNLNLRKYTLKSRENRASFQTMSYMSCTCWKKGFKNFDYWVGKWARIILPYTTEQLQGNL